MSDDRPDLQRLNFSIPLSVIGVSVLVGVATAAMIFLTEPKRVDVEVIDNRHSEVECETDWTTLQKMWHNENSVWFWRVAERCARFRYYYVDDYEELLRDKQVELPQEKPK
jgi:hypothetical protein